MSWSRTPGFRESGALGPRCSPGRGGRGAGSLSAGEADGGDGRFAHYCLPVKGSVSEQGREVWKVLPFYLRTFC